MKKNKMMRTASGVMVATLLTTGVISGTFAKYTTSSDAKDSARVAKWGVTLAASGSLYGKKYNGANTNTIIQDTKETATVESAATADDKVIAPGTKNENGLHIQLSGTPEVSTKVSAVIREQNIYLNAGEYGVMEKAVGVTKENFGNRTYYTKSDAGVYSEENNFIDDSTDYYVLNDEVSFTGAAYYPVTYTGAGVTGKGTNDDTLDLIAKNIASKLMANSSAAITGTAGSGEYDGYTVYTVSVDDAKTYAPNDDLGDALKGVFNSTIGWEWKFGTEGVATEDDKKDTILGNLMAEAINSTKTVVKKTVTTYTPVEVNKNTGVAKVGQENVASIHTGLCIDVTVDQVD